MTAQPSPAHEAVDDEKLLVHNWRVARLTGLGIPGPLAEVNADRLDWHQVARLVPVKVAGVDLGERPGDAEPGEPCHPPVVPEQLFVAGGLVGRARLRRHDRPLHSQY